MEKALTIGEVAKEANVGVQTLRYYERRGLLAPARRSAGGYRLFVAETVRRVRFIRHAQALGFSLEEIADLLTLRVTHPRQCDDVREAAERTRDRVRERVAHLRRMERTLDRLVHACVKRRRTEPCPVLTALEPGDDA